MKVRRKYLLFFQTFIAFKSNCSKINSITIINENLPEIKSNENEKKILMFFQKLTAFNQIVQS